ncbi:MAG: hypothetical protein K0Q51_396, partial [Rickettsiaceae bacterium]|nr:hypothetical protein [Rickettsiaceae bacterium]
MLKNNVENKKTNHKKTLLLITALTTTLISNEAIAMPNKNKQAANQKRVEYQKQRNAATKARETHNQQQEAEKNKLVNGFAALPFPNTSTDEIEKFNNPIFLNNNKAVVVHNNNRNNENSNLPKKVKVLIDLDELLARIRENNKLPAITEGESLSKKDMVVNYRAVAGAENTSQGKDIVVNTPSTAGAGDTSQSKETVAGDKVPQTVEFLVDIDELIARIAADKNAKNIFQVQDP